MKKAPFPSQATSLETNGLTIERDEACIAVYGPLNFTVQNQKASVEQIKSLLAGDFGDFETVLRPILESALAHILSDGYKPFEPPASTVAGNPFI